MSAPCPHIFQTQPKTALPMPKQLNQLLYRSSPVQPSTSAPTFETPATITAARIPGMVRPL